MRSGKSNEQKKSKKKDAKDNWNCTERGEEEGNGVQLDKISLNIHGKRTQREAVAGEGKAK